MWGGLWVCLWNRNLGIGKGYGDGPLDGWNGLVEGMVGVFNIWVLSREDPRT